MGYYLDEARSGTSRKHRGQFNQMMEDAQKGKIDYIITKSISRFARNTVDTLECVRLLQRLCPPVGIYFEKENIDTLNSNSEMFLTLYSSIAQEESRSISENIRWAFQKNFREGKPTVNLNRMMGYDKGEDGTWIINEKQADVVRFIFNRFIQGDSGRAIAARLNELGIPTALGRQWRSDGIYYILRNEKYAGDVEMQKTVTESYLTHRSVPNVGQVPKYFVTGHHDPIIDMETWKKAQILLELDVEKEQETENPNEKPRRRRGPKRSPFYILKCGKCGAPLKRMFYRISGQESEKGKGEEPGWMEPVWKCKEEKGLRESAIEQSFMELLYYLKRQYEKEGCGSALVRKFRTACKEERRRESTEGYGAYRMELLEMQIRELEGDGGQKEGNRVSEQRLEAVQAERRRLLQEQDRTGVWEAQFEEFLQALRALPDKNAGGSRLHIHSMDSPPFDFLKFDCGLFGTFIIEARVYEDMIRYKTNFGVELTTTGNGRTWEDFAGDRIFDADGSCQIIVRGSQLGKAKGRGGKRKREGLENEIDKI